MGGFSELVDDMDAAIAEALSDGAFDYLDRNGVRLVESLAGIVEQGVERLDVSAIDRFRTLEVRKRLLPRVDNKGSFLDEEGNAWSIDGIHADDGDWITFYVVPV